MLNIVYIKVAIVRKEESEIFILRRERPLISD